MKLKINVKSEPSHKLAVTCLGWSGIDEVYTSGDDGQLLAWNVSQNEFTKITQLNNEILPTNLQFLSKSSTTKHSDVFLITSTDGKFYILNKSGRIERVVEAHKGAILVGQWSNDAVSLMTCGEDGFIKIWSRGGMLRSTLVSSDNSIYSACWSNDSQSIVYTQGNLLLIKELTPNSVAKKWIAHDSLVLCVSWSNSGVIVSGGEDCRYKVWDDQGHQLYSSVVQDNPITSVAFSSEGDLFAVGSFNSLRLCDYYGYSKALEKPTTGCIYKLAFSIDGTQIAAGCANGQVLFANVLDRTVSYGNYIATIAEKKTITLLDILNETIESLELPERIIRMNLRYSNLVVTTPNQCYIYSNTNWNTPNVFDLKGNVTLLLLSQKHMLLAETNSLGIYNYQTRLIASPRWPNMKTEALKPSTIALSSDLLVVRDEVDNKILYVLDLTSNKSTNERYTTVTHFLPIVQISLDQYDGDSSNRKLAILDNAKDLYVVDVRSSNSVPSKIGGQIQSFLWNSELNFLAAVQDTQLTVWYCPSAAYDANLLQLSSYQYDSSDLGKSPRIEDFVGNFVHLRRADGALINVSISPFPAILNRYIRENKWKNARCLCRTIDERTLWTCLAVLTTQSNNTDLLEMAEEAYAEIEQYDKVFYIQDIKINSTKAEILAGQALLGGLYQKAELILLQNGLIYRAIQMHLNLYNWNRALSLAIKQKSYVDIVLYKRLMFLKELDKEETNEMYLAIKDSVPMDVEKIQKKMEMEETNVRN